jgi:hypothetical protein
MRNSFINWTSKSFLVAFALCVSVVAQAQDATYSAEASAYAVAVQNDLANASASITFNETALTNESRISGVINIIGDGSHGSGQDFIVRANSDYSLDVTVPSLPYNTTECQPAFSTTDTSFGAVGELLISIQSTTVTFNDLGFSATNEAGISASVACDNVAGEATITFDVSLSETNVDTFTFGLGFLPDGARQDDGSDYGANNEPPAGTYSLSLTASLSTG